MRLKKIDIIITPVFVIVIPVLYITGYLGEYALLLLSISLHELGHILTARCLKLNIKKIYILPVGIIARIEQKPGLSCLKYILLPAAGPAFNMLAVCMTAAIRWFFIQEVDLDFFMLANLCIGLFNLLPVLPLDGGNILRSILQKGYRISKALKVMSVLNVVIAVVMIFAGVIQLCQNIYNFSLILIGGVLLYSIKKEAEAAVIMNIKQLMFKKERFLKRGIYPVRYVAALESVTLRQLFKDMDCDCYHIIHILDNNFNINCTLTEERVIEGMMKCGFNAKVSDLLEVLDVSAP